MTKRNLIFISFVILLATFIFISDIVNIDSKIEDDAVNGLRALTVENDEDVFNLVNMSYDAIDNHKEEISFMKERLDKLYKLNNITNYNKLMNQENVEYPDSTTKGFIDDLKNNYLYLYSLDETYIILIDYHQMIKDHKKVISSELKLTLEYGQKNNYDNIYNAKTNNFNLGVLYELIIEGESILKENNSFEYGAVIEEYIISNKMTFYGLTHTAFHQLDETYKKDYLNQLKNYSTKDEDDFNKEISTVYSKLETEDFKRSDSFKKWIEDIIYE